MKLAPILAVLCFAMSGPQAGSGELETIVKDKLQALQVVTAALKSATDSKSAEAAVAKMDVALEHLIVCDEVLADPKVVVRLKKDKLEDKYGKQLADAQAAVQKEIDRLAKQPMVIKCIAEGAAWKRWQSLPKASVAMERVFIDPLKLERTKNDLRNLDAALSTYNIRQKSYPQSLKDLTQRQPDGGVPLVKDVILNDQWDRPYQYDPDQRDPVTDRPRVWSQGPSPGQPGSEIANWTSKSPSKK
jgi:hypothetical protein